jgi:hypothetical protein
MTVDAAMDPKRCCRQRLYRDAVPVAHRYEAPLAQITKYCRISETTLDNSPKKADVGHGTSQETAGTAELRDAKKWISLLVANVSGCGTPVPG